MSELQKSAFFKWRVCGSGGLEAVFSVLMVIVFTFVKLNIMCLCCLVWPNFNSYEPGIFFVGQRQTE